MFHLIFETLPNPVMTHWFDQLFVNVMSQLPYCYETVILVLAFCPHNTSPMCLGWLFFLNKVFCYLSPKKKNYKKG